MAETMRCSADNELGCGFMNTIFQRRGFSRRTSGGKPFPANSNNSSVKFPSVNGRRGASVSDATRSSTSSSSNSSILIRKEDSQLPEFAECRRRRRKEPTFTSGELSLTTTANHHQLSTARGTHHPPSSSGNITLLGQLGNLKQQGTNKTTLTNSPKAKSLDFHIGTIVRKTSGKSPKVWKPDPEALKSMGNEKYKQGRFEEALDLYNRAISLDSNRASYHSNKGAALIGLGRLIEAAFECREAVRIEPSYHRAHHRLATLYLRLGEAEKAMDHYKQAGFKADTEDIAKAQALKTHIAECANATKLRDWTSLLKESHSAIFSGADSAPQIYAMQVDALLKLHRHREAYNTFQKGPNFDTNSCTRFFGPTCTAYLLIVRAQIYMVVGRFEDALSSGQQAARLDSSNKVKAFMKRAQAVAMARSIGNKMFEASKILEASAAYSEGLEHDPFNSILLCNRAACRFKLGQFEKAVEDCTAALNVLPSYGRARLRRANCNAKLERWEAAIQDYETLIRETPGDEEVGRALFEARVQLKKYHGEDTEDMKFGSNLIFISSNGSFRHFVTSPGMSVVLFCNKTCHKQVLQLMEQVCKGFPSVNFLKVEIEKHPYLAKSEGVSTIPAFKIYKNGSKMKEIPGNNRELLESSVKLYSS